MPFTENPKKSQKRCFAVIEKECVLHSDGSELDFDDLLDFKRRYPNADFIEETQKNKEGGQPPYVSTVAQRQQFRLSTVRGHPATPRGFSGVFKCIHINPAAHSKRYKTSKEKTLL